MFSRPTSHPAAHRGSRGLATLPSAIAAIALAGLALAACSAPAGGALSGPASDNLDAHRAREQQRNAFAAFGAAPAVTTDDGWDSLRKEHQATAATIAAGPIVVPQGAR